MADASKIKTSRLKAETAIYELLDSLENKKNGFNSTQMRAYFSTLNDQQFVKFMQRLDSEEWFNLSFEINMGDKKTTPDMHRIDKIAKKYGIELNEYVAFPFKNPNDLSNPIITKNKVPVLYCMVRPLAQLLDKKEAYASGRRHVNSLTGQVTSTDKASTFSNMQSIALTTSNQLDTLKELLGPRADDEESKSKMLRQIEETGKFDINSITTRTKDKQSIETIRVMLTGAGLRVAFNNEKLSYVLPK